MNRKTIGLVGNPNVGKSTLFNALTGMRQHTGNWPGKTVEQAKGYFLFKDREYELIDLPGTYSLFSNSKEETITRKFIEEKLYDMIIVVMDATCLKRTLLLGLQIAQQCSSVLFVINLMDEAHKQGIEVNGAVLEKNVHIPLVELSAKDTRQIIDLKQRIHECIDKETPLFRFPYPPELQHLIQQHQTQYPNAKQYESCNAVIEKSKHKETLLDIQIEAQYHKTQNLCRLCVKEIMPRSSSRVDYYLTHPVYGSLLMLGMLGILCFITIIGANYPSTLLFTLFTTWGEWLREGLGSLNISSWLIAFLMDGIYLILSFVVSVMLPPMAIFFTLFSYLEEYGLLPRIAFNLDGYFHRCLGNGKQALCMCMGLGCNCVGVSGCRIMESEKDQQLGIITNALMPCNGRFPMLITIISLFFTISFPSFTASIIGALLLSGCICLSIASTFLITYLLARFLYGQQKATFVLELPPFRKPKIRTILTHSLLNKTLTVLGKAVVVSALAGAVIYGLAATPILGLLIRGLTPLGHLLGVDGNVLTAFLLASPANEIVLPILLMTYQGTGHIAQLDLGLTYSLLIANGWNIQRALCFLILVLFHFPCITTLLTIYKETRSKRVVLLSLIVPSVYGALLCMGINLLFYLFQ